MTRIRYVRRGAALGLVALGLSALASCTSVVSGNPSAIGSSSGDADSAPSITSVPAAIGCAVPSVPPGASDAAVAYARAVNRAAPAWSRIDATLAAEGDIVHRNDLIDQVNADTAFVSDVSAIKFPTAIQPEAAHLIDTIKQYDALLQIAYTNDGYYAAHHADFLTLDDIRVEASGQLRVELGLPLSHCTFRRP